MGCNEIECDKKRRLGYCLIFLIRYTITQIISARGIKPKTIPKNNDKEKNEEGKNKSSIA